MVKDTILKLSFELGFDNETAYDDINAVKKEFKQCLKESIVDILQNESITSFNIIDAGIIDDGKVVPDEIIRIGGEL